MPRLLVVILLAATLPARSSEPPRDPLGRTTPQDAIFQFLEACHAREYSKAAHYLDLRQMSPADREKKGPQLAQQLEDLLDDTPFDIATLSRSPEGDLSDGLSPSRERLATFQVNGHPLELDLERVELKPGIQGLARLCGHHPADSEGPPACRRDSHLRRSCRRCW